MTRLKGQDNLDDIAGKLTAGFNAVTLKTLEQKFKAAGPKAAKVLTDFYLAAAQLQKGEREFNRRAKPQQHDHMVNLRNDEQLGAMRDFETAKRGLLEMNPEVGGQILAVVDRNLVSSTKPAPRPTAKKSFAAAVPSPA
ncbi:MAG: hypothetical protein ACAH83_16700 [Alphaproteobacteria bacterium]